MDKFGKWLLAAGKVELGAIFLAALLANICGHELVGVGWAFTGYALQSVSALAGGAIAVLLFGRK